MTENVIIRQERAEDEATVENLVREAFWNVYRPGCLEHYVLHRLRASPNFVRELAFVMEEDGRIIGQNVFVRTAIHLDGDGMPPFTCAAFVAQPSAHSAWYIKFRPACGSAKSSAQKLCWLCASA